MMILCGAPMGLETFRPVTVVVIPKRSPCSVCPAGGGFRKSGRDQTGHHDVNDDVSTRTGRVVSTEQMKLPLCNHAIVLGLAVAALAMLVPFDFSSLWQEEDLSDVDIQLTAGSQTAHPAFPAHSAILSCSPFLKAQMLRWQPSSTQADSSSSCCCSSSSHSSTKSDDTVAWSKRQLNITLPDEQQVPAAMAVFAALYGVKAIPELLSELTQEQQLHAAVLADMWQIDAVSKGAAKLLNSAAQSSDGLSAAAIKQLLSMPAYPDCLVPLVQTVLLDKLGDVEAVWGDAELQELLLGLSLAAMELLLASDELKATSEDNVLYTAQQYVDNITDPQQKQAAAQRLAPLIRCPHVSSFWLSASVLSDDAPKLLLNQLSRQVGKLVMAQQGQPGQPLKEPHKLLPGSPASWVLGKRASKPPSSVQVTWELEVSKLRQAAKDSARQQKAVTLGSPTVSPPLGGITWGLWLQAFWDADQQGSSIGIFAVPQNKPVSMCLQFVFNLQAAGLSRSVRSRLLQANPISSCQGWQDALRLGPLAGRWDEAAWASKGLPATGQLDLTLTVTSVGYCSS